MSITDELRECIATAIWQYEDDIKTAYIPKDKLLAIADRIDAAVDGMVELPKDADGNTINVGDIVKLRDEFEVRQLVLVDKDLWVVEDRFGEPFNPDKLHHVAPDTWESIIEDAMQYARTTNMPYPAVSIKGDELVDRCKRLAGEA